MPAEMFALGRQKMIGVPLFKSVAQTLEIIWTMIVYHAYLP